MDNKDFAHSLGFTLAEIIVSLLLLSILAVGSFKTLHHVQSSSNLNLTEFQKIQLQQQLFTLNKLKQTYVNISSDPQFESLSCLIEHASKCP